MENLQSAVDSLVHSSNTLFILIGAVMVLAMHAGFAFLEVGTVRQKNQVNALSGKLARQQVRKLVLLHMENMRLPTILSDCSHGKN